MDVAEYVASDPRGFLADHPDGAVIDEFQRVPELASSLQVAIDEDPRPGRWILSGSQNLAVARTVSQSLAGRTDVLTLLPLSRREVRRFADPPATLDEALLHGGYPRIVDRGLTPHEWFRGSVATSVKRDVRQITQIGDLETFKRFLALCAGRTSQLLNLSSLAADVGVSQPTARSWLSVLEATFIVHLLPAWHANVRKRLVKRPRLHFVDTALACWLLGISETDQLRMHPLRGPLFETWMVTEALEHRLNTGLPGGPAHYRDQNGADVDLVVGHQPELVLIDAKAGATPSGAMLDPVRRVRGLLEPHLPATTIRGAAVYGGIDPQSRGDDRLVPWDPLDAAAPSLGLGDAP